MRGLGWRDLEGRKGIIVDGKVKKRRVWQQIHADQCHKKKLEEGPKRALGSLLKNENKRNVESLLTKVIKKPKESNVNERRLGCMKGEDSDVFIFTDLFIKEGRGSWGNPDPVGFLDSGAFMVRLSVIQTHWNDIFDNF